MTNSDCDEARARLRAAGRVRTRTVTRLAKVEAALEDAIVAADECGVPRLTIAKEAGVVRATVYLVLERKGAHIREPVAVADA